MLCSQVKLEMWSPTETQIVWSSSDCWMVQRPTCVTTKFREAWSDVCYAGTTIHGPGNDIFLYTRLGVRGRRCTLRVPTFLGMLHLSLANVVWTEFAPPVASFTHPVYREHFKLQTCVSFNFCWITFCQLSQVSKFV